MGFFLPEECQVGALGQRYKLLGTPEPQLLHSQYRGKQIGVQKETMSQHHHQWMS